MVGASGTLTQSLSNVSPGLVGTSVLPGPLEGAGNFLCTWIDGGGGRSWSHAQGRWMRLIRILVPAGAGIQPSSFVSLGLSFQVYKMVKIRHVEAS